MLTYNKVISEFISKSALNLLCILPANNIQLKTVMKAFTYSFKTNYFNFSKTSYHNL